MRIFIFFIIFLSVFLFSCLVMPPVTSSWMFPKNKGVNIKSNPEKIKKMKKAKKKELKIQRQRETLLNRFSNKSR